tara:strand:- start:97 stop:252 length:156 start_codon:yes stop_codon:yes gene_type:complete
MIGEYGDIKAIKFGKARQAAQRVEPIIKYRSFIVASFTLALLNPPGSKNSP